jgi:hypothetical protein
MAGNGLAVILSKQADSAGTRTPTYPVVPNLRFLPHLRLGAPLAPHSSVNMMMGLLIYYQRIITTTFAENVFYAYLITCSTNQGYYQAASCQETS